VHRPDHHWAAASLALTAGAAIAAWRRAKMRAARAESQLSLSADELRALREELQARQQRLQDAQREHRLMMEKVKRSWRAEREWIRELREQIHRLQARAGAVERRDVHALVLETAIELVGAQKGLLLSRQDADGDGDLDLVVARGFEHDAERSAVAQRFARAVLARDEILREDEPTVPDGADRTEADDEIESLVAIPLYLRDRFSGVVICANRPDGFGEIDDDVLLGLGDHAGAAMHHAQLRQELREVHRGAIRMLAEAVAARDPTTHGESSQLAVHAVTLARELDFDERQRDVLVCATLVRTVGHLALPSHLLSKPGPLEPDERAMVELHPRIGFDVVRQLPALRDVATAVLYHHERFDGSGYPAGLVGRETPVEARALAVLEAFGALTHDRPYRPRRSREEACGELLRCAGTQFDPDIAAALVAEVRGRAAAPAEHVAEAVLDALPLGAAGGADGVLGPLAGPDTDGLTLLGNHRALREGVRAATGVASAEDAFAVVVLQLEELGQVNDDAGPLAGDRLIQAAARNAQRVAIRLGGRAYRDSGRRLAIIAPLRNGRGAEELLEEIRIEFATGPAVRSAAAVWGPGDSGDDVVGRARSAVRT
jgi:HD-GYP domain-containing protein (c-di-GMP phosphodiesterase class II)/GGDEF domain-containing protein